MIARRVIRLSCFKGWSFLRLDGFAAVLIREFVSRSDLGMCGTLLLATAFGVVQAGVIDQSLFRESYLGISVWEQMTVPTRIPQLGISGYTAVTFVAGHIIYSYVAPILIVEGLFPASSRKRWLGKLGVFILLVLYLVSAFLVLDDHLSTETSHASASEICYALAFSMVLAFFAYLRPQRYFPNLPHFQMAVAWVFVAGLAGGVAMDFAPTSWFGTIVVVCSLTFLAAIGYFARLSRTHCTALAFGLLLSRCLTAFSYFPLRGDISAFEKYSHNVFFAILVAVVGLVSLQRSFRFYAANTQSGSPGTTPSG